MRIKWINVPETSTAGNLWLRKYLLVGQVRIKSHPVKNGDWDEGKGVQLIVDLRGVGIGDKFIWEFFWTIDNLYEVKQVDF